MTNNKNLTEAEKSLYNRLAKNPSIYVAPFYVEFTPEDRATVRGLVSKGFASMSAQFTGHAVKLLK